MPTELFNQLYKTECFSIKSGHIIGLQNLYNKTGLYTYYSKNFSIKLLFKSFITEVLECKLGLNKRIVCMHYYVFLSDESLLT